MSIWHKFFSPSSAAVDGKVGGPQWNEDHCYGDGSIIPVAQASIYWDSANSLVGENYRTPSLGAFSAPNIGGISAGFVPPDIPLAAGLKVEYSIHLSPSPNGSLPTGWYFFAIYNGENMIKIGIKDATDAYADLPIDCDFWLTVNAVVMPV